jgi:hypothetical protein
MVVSFILSVLGKAFFLLMGFILGFLVCLVKDSLPKLPKLW